MKLNIIAYLSKPDLEIDDLIDSSKSSQSENLVMGQREVKLFLRKSSNPPAWSKLFSETEITPNTFNQNSISGALAIPIHNEIIIFTFGHGRSLINKQSIVRGFGLRVAMNLGDPRQLKSIDKATLDRVSLNTRSQSSKNTGVENFNFEFDHEIMRSITAIVDRDDEELEIISGSDSVAIYTEISFATLDTLAQRLLSAYKSTDYLIHYPWAEFITPESDPVLKQALDEILVEKLNNKEFDDLWIAPPEIVPYEDFSGFKYKNTSGSPKYIELNLSSYITDAGFRGSITTSSIKNKKVYILNATETAIESWSFYRCLNGELELNNQKYILNDGVWYSVNDDFYNEVCDYFDTIPESSLTFPAYGGLNEGEYLRSIVNNIDVALLDQCWVRPKGVGNNLEFCDLYSECKAIIHVKKHGSSAVLNHLFAQASQSIEMLINSPEVIEQVNSHLSSTPLKINFTPDQEREHRIVLAIMYPRVGALDIPFFAKVNLRNHVRKIRAMGFDVEFSKIELGSKIFSSASELRDLLAAD